MLFLAKAALGLGGTLALATAYTFHEGVVRVDVDDWSESSHIHVWVPSTVVSSAIYLTPRQSLQNASAQVRPYLPLLRQLSKELPKYPNAVFVDVRDCEGHVRIATLNGKLIVEATEPKQNVHVTVPLALLRDVADKLEDAAPGV